MKRSLFLLSLSLLLLMQACVKDTITEVDTVVADVDTDSDGGDVYDASDFDRDIAVVYSGTSATVSGESSDFTVSISGGHVTIVNNGRDKVRYRLSGSCDDGWFKLYSSRRQAILLEGVSLANPNGAAINVQGPQDSVSKGKRTFVVLSGSNTLADGSSYTLTPSGEDEKAVMFGEGQFVFSGDGSLAVTAQGKSGIVSDDYVNVVSGTISVTMSSAAKVVDGDTLKPACIKGKDAFLISGGSLTLTATGTGAKGISGDGTATFNGGMVTVTVSGSNFGSSSGGWGGGGHGPGGGGSSSDNSVGAKGLKFDGDIVFNGGTVVVKATNHEAIESKGTMTFNGGDVYGWSSKDDAINSASTMTVNDGYVCAISAGNDGLDANGNLYIKGGFVYAVGATSPEVAVDANTEGGYKLYVQGGTLVALGNLEGGAQLSQNCYQSSSWTKNAWYSITVGDETYAFKTPSSGGNKLVVSGSEQPTVMSGVTATGGTSHFDGQMLENPTVSGGSSVSLSTYSGNSGWGW